MKNSFTNCRTLTSPPRSENEFLALAGGCGLEALMVSERAGRAGGAGLGFVDARCGPTTLLLEVVGATTIEFVGRGGGAGMTRIGEVGIEGLL